MLPDYSISTLIQAHETDNGVGYVTDGVVHYGTYLENAVQLLSQVQNLDELMTIMSRLQWDVSLFGLDKLNTIVREIETAWGTVLQETYANANIVVTYANPNAESQFAQSMSNTTYAGAAASAPYSPQGSGSGSGAGGSQNPMEIAQKIQGMIGQLFGQSGGTMQEMWKRLATTQEQTATDMHRKLTQEDKAQKHNQVNKGTVQGQGDPLSDDVFDNLFSVTTGP
jgi:hypothetical protein